MTEDEREPLVLGDLYEGGFGPTLVLEAQSLAGVEWFHLMLAELSTREGPAFDLAAMPELKMEGVGELRVEAAVVQPRVSLTRRVGARNHDARFLWRQDTLRWAHAAMLMEPLLGGRPGHQYLTSQGRDAILVEFSHGEGLGIGRG